MIKLPTSPHEATLNQMIEGTGVASTHSAWREGSGPEKTGYHLNSTKDANQ